MTAESRAHPIIFGTDGWRGILGEDMTAETVARVVQAFAEYLRGRNARRGVAIAYDGRAFSLGFSVLSARILSANGFVVVRSDRVLPTPVLSWTVSARGHDAGIMFTASHNPPKYNGTKFKAACGGPFMTEETHAVERLLGRTPPPLGGQAGRPADLLSPYCEHLARLIRFDIIRAARLHVIIDSMWGAGATILEDLLRRNGCAARTIAGTPEHDFCGRSPEPVERNLSPLMDAMRSDPSAAVGFATDGDADRLGVVLDGGRWLSARKPSSFSATTSSMSGGRRGMS